MKNTFGAKMKTTKQPSVCWIGIFLLFLSISGVRSKIHENEFRESNTMLQKALTALKGALNFFTTQYKQVNLDAVIGTRMVEG